MAVKLICMWSIMGTLVASAEPTTETWSPSWLKSTWNSWMNVTEPGTANGTSDGNGSTLWEPTEEWRDVWKEEEGSTINPAGSNLGQASQAATSTSWPTEQERPLTFQANGWNDTTTVDGLETNTIWTTSDATFASPTAEASAKSTPTDAEVALVLGIHYSNRNEPESLDSSEEVKNGEESQSVDPWPWLLFILSGNTTVASRRQRDLGTYLRLNLAARLDADYNDVVINRILLTQATVMANISVEPSHLVGVGAVGLDALGQGNVTLLELSGQEFLVDRIIRADEFTDQRVMSAMDVAAMVDSELTVYGAVGAVFVFLFLALFLGLVFHGPCQNLDKYPHERPIENDLPLDHQGESSESKCPSPGPPVIYTEQLAREMDDAVNLLDVGAHYSCGGGTSGPCGDPCGPVRSPASRNTSIFWYNHVIPSVGLRRAIDAASTCPPIDLTTKIVDLQIDADYGGEDRHCCQISSEDYKEIESQFQRLVRQPMDASMNLV